MCDLFGLSSDISHHICIKSTHKWNRKYSTKQVNAELGQCPIKLIFAPIVTFYYIKC